MSLLGFILAKGFLKLKKIYNQDAYLANFIYILAFLSGILGYCIASIFNDNLNGVTLCFWIFLGILASLVVKKDFKPSIT